jgi:hypothetical protein
MKDIGFIGEEFGIQIQRPPTNGLWILLMAQKHLSMVFLYLVRSLLFIKMESLA